MIPGSHLQEELGPPAKCPHNYVSYPKLSCYLFYWGANEVHKCLNPEKALILPLPPDPIYSITK